MFDYPILPDPAYVYDLGAVAALERMREQGYFQRTRYDAPPPKTVKRHAAARMRFSGLYLRISRTAGLRSQTHIYLSSMLSVALDRPARVDIRRDGGALALVPCGDTGGYAVTHGRNDTHACWLCCNSAAPLLEGYAGVFRVAVENGRAVVGERLA